MRPESPEGEPSGGLPRWSTGLQWLILVVMSAALAGLMGWVGVPAALLMGPMIAGIVVGTNGGSIRVADAVFVGAQAMIGCLVAEAINAQAIGTFVSAWTLFLPLVAAVVVASSLLGWMVSRWSTLPGSTAVWGSSPGAATAMMVMAQAFGADARLVAFMQYLRVVLVAVSAALVARFWVDAPVAGTEAVWFPAVDWASFLGTLAIAATGGWVGVKLRVPAGAFLGPMAAAAVLHGSGAMTLELPQWLLAASYAFIGWHIGLRFTREIVVHASRALPQIILGILLLLGFCGGLALLLSRLTGIDPLTAYLAMSPGGMDSIAIIAAAAAADLPFIMTLQTARFLMVLLLGPPLARFIAKRTKKARSDL